MIGARNRDMIDLLYVQAKEDPDDPRNPTKALPWSMVEEILWKDDVQDKQPTDRSKWLETCGYHATANAYVLVLKDPVGFEKWFKEQFAGIRFPDVLAALGNTPAFYPVIQQGRPGFDPHSLNASEVPQYHALVLNYIMGLYGRHDKAAFSWGLGWNQVVGKLHERSTIVLCRTDIGHYVTAYKYNETRDLVICADSRGYESDHWDQEFDRARFAANIATFGTVIPEET